MARVRDILASKSQDVHKLTPENSVLEALELMARENIGAVPIISDGRLAGIFTERLYARNVFLKGLASPKTSLEEVMVREVATVTPDTTVEECMVLMNDKRIRHLTVISEDRVTGIVSIGDLMHRIIQEREIDIENLVDYISR